MRAGSSPQAWLRSGGRFALRAIPVACDVGGPHRRDRGRNRQAPPGRGPGARPTITVWLDTVLPLYAECALAFEARAARIAGGLFDLARSKGQAPGFADLAIAATAQLRSFTILTRNARRFEPLGFPFLDPFVGLP